LLALELTLPDLVSIMKNVGGADRVLRIVAGLAVLGAGLYFKSWWGLVGLVPLGTAAIGWCPAYLPFGISTCRARKP
jgi:hypothetical protein